MTSNWEGVRQLSVVGEEGVGFWSVLGTWLGCSGDWVAKSRCLGASLRGWS